MRTEQEWIKALSRWSDDCIFLDAVPVDQRTHAVCLAAVKKYGRDLKHVPVPLRTVEICSEALYKGFGGFWHDAERKEFIPEAIVQEVQKAVEERKKNDKLYNAWLTLVKNDWRVLKYVPDHLRREGIIKAALKQSPEATAMIVANISLSQDQIDRLRDSMHKFYSGTQNSVVILPPEKGMD
jgi:hypothetical protein